MRDMADLLEAMRKMMEETGQKKREDKKDDYQKVILDEKYSRRMEVFDGDRLRFRGWIFDLTVCVGKVDKELAGQMVKLIASVRSKDDGWDPRLDQEVDQELYEKYEENCMESCVN